MLRYIASRSYFQRCHHLARSIEGLFTNVKAMEIAVRWCQTRIYQVLYSIDRSISDDDSTAVLAESRGSQIIADRQSMMLLFALAFDTNPKQRTHWICARRSGKVEVRELGHPRWTAYVVVSLASFHAQRARWYPKDGTVKKDGCGSGGITDLPISMSPRPYMRVTKIQSLRGLHYNLAHAISLCVLSLSTNGPNGSSQYIIKNYKFHSTRTNL